MRTSFRGSAKLAGVQQRDQLAAVRSKPAPPPAKEMRFALYKSTRLELTVCHLILKRLLDVTLTARHHVSEYHAALPYQSPETRRTQ